MSSFIERFFKEPYINILCVELGINLDEYKQKRNRNIVMSLILAALFIFVGVVLKSIIIMLLAVVIAYLGYRSQYLKVKQIERKTKEELVKMYPILVQTFISLLYTNDNLLKVFILLQNYHFHPYIDRNLIIMINKYQVNPENSELIFGEFCNIFETSSASLLHQLLVNVNNYGINDNEIELLEKKVEQEYNRFIVQKEKEDSKKIALYGNAGVVLFVAMLLVVVISTL